jgi:hypothetical protein
MSHDIRARFQDKITIQESIETTAIFLMVERGHDFDNVCEYFASNTIFFPEGQTWREAVEFAIQTCEGWIREDSQRREKYRNDY